MTPRQLREKYAFHEGPEVTQEVETITSGTALPELAGPVGALAPGRGWGEPAEIVRIGDDPHGRGERTVFYRQPKTHGAAIFYCWVKHWPAEWTALPNVEMTGANRTEK
jgi:hypothetical protein